MSNFNKVILIGNLTRDPELRYTPSGKAIAKLGLAINRKWKSESGEQREETTFVDVDAFGKQAETLGQYLRKGRPVMVEGRLKLDQWEDKQTGKQRTRLGVVMETFQFISGGKSESQPASTQTQSPPPDASRNNQPADNDDVPF